MEGGEFLELLLHGLGLDFADHLCDVGLVGEFGGVGGGEGHEAGCWAVVLPFCDVEEVDVVLGLLVVVDYGGWDAYVDHLELFIFGDFDCLTGGGLEGEELLSTLLWGSSSSGCGGESRHERD